MPPNNNNYYLILILKYTYKNILTLTFTGGLERSANIAIVLLNVVSVALTHAKMDIVAASTKYSVHLEFISDGRGDGWYRKVTESMK